MQENIGRPWEKKPQEHGGLPSGKRLHNLGKSPFLPRKTPIYIIIYIYISKVYIYIYGPFSIAV